MTSFLHIDKISEYFSQTTAIVQNKLSYIRGVEIHGAAQSKFRVLMYLRESEKIQEEVEFVVSNYDEALKHVKPFLPPTRFFLGSNGEPWLCGFSPCQNWKRSFAYPRYKKIRVGAPVKKYGDSTILDPPKFPVDFQPVPPRLLVEAFEELEHSGIMCLDKDFAVVESPKLRQPLIYYHSFPVAKVNDMGLIVPHPRYHEFFLSRLREFGEVVHEN